MLAVAVLNYLRDGSQVGRAGILVVTGARTALGQETATQHIRSVVDNYGRLDSSNFMMTLGKMPEISVLGGRGSPNRTIRMKVSGVEKAQELAQQLIGE